jgi:small subunit ribosomal protein S18
MSFDTPQTAGAPKEAGEKKTFFRRKRTCPLSEKGAPKVDYKDVKLLSRFVSERGKIMPRRITSISAKKQRELSTAIKRARNLALMPYVTQFFKN